MAQPLSHTSAYVCSKVSTSAEEKATSRVSSAVLRESWSDEGAAKPAVHPDDLIPHYHHCVRSPLRACIPKMARPLSHTSAYVCSKVSTSAEEKATSRVSSAVLRESWSDEGAAKPAVHPDDYSPTGDASRLSGSNDRLLV